MPKKGVPYKFDKVRRKAYLAELREGHGRESAAHNVGMTARAVRKYLASHPEFADRISEAEMEANGKVESFLFNKAKTGDVVAIQVWLYNRAPERWQDRRGAAVRVETPPHQITNNTQNVLVVDVGAAAPPQQIAGLLAAGGISVPGVVPASLAKAHASAPANEAEG